MSFDRSQIDALRQSAAELSALSRALTKASAGLADAEGTGSDDAGIATATVRGGGVLTDLTISDGWRTKIASSQLGPVVFAAVDAARTDLENQWERAVADGVETPIAPPPTATYRMSRPDRPSPAALAARVDAIVDALDEQDSYLEAVEAGTGDSSYTSPAGYFTVHTASGRVTSLEPDDYRLTFASPTEIARDIRAVFQREADRADLQDEELNSQFPAIAELRRRVAERG